MADPQVVECSYLAELNFNLIDLEHINIAKNNSTRQDVSVRGPSSADCGECTDDTGKCMISMRGSDVSMGGMTVVLINNDKRRLISQCMLAMFGLRSSHNQDLSLCWSS